MRNSTATARDSFSLAPFVLEHVPGNMLAPYAWPGAYVLLYIGEDGEAFCGHCLNTSGNRHFRRDVVAVDCLANMDEETAGHCVQCNRPFAEI
jgi:hypothetical protein